MEESEEISDSNEPKNEQQPDELVEDNFFGAGKKGSKSKKQRRDPVTAKGGATGRKTRSQINQKQEAKPAQNKKVELHQAISLGKRKRRGKLDLQRVFDPEYYHVPDEFADSKLQFSTYLSVTAQPSKQAGRFFCSVCGYWSKYSCTRCGLRYCSLKCQDVHKETRCIKFAE